MAEDLVLDEFAPYVRRDRAMWAQLAEAMPVDLSEETLERIRSSGDRIDLDHVREVYHPLTELVRHLPRHAVLDAARSLHALRMQNQPCEGGKMDPFGQWWIYLCQTAGLVEAERAAMPETYQFP